jgi:hypothetical protein
MRPERYRAHGISAMCYGGSYYQDGNGGMHRLRLGYSLSCRHRDLQGCPISTGLEKVCPRAANDYLPIQPSLVQSASEDTGIIDFSTRGQGPIL